MLGAEQRGAIGVVVRQLAALDQYGVAMPSEKATALVMHDSVYFDRWYADMISSPARDAIIARAMGMPAELRDAGALLWEALAPVALLAPL